MERIVRPIERSSVHRGSATRSSLQSQLHLRPAPPLHYQPTLEPLSRGSQSTTVLRWLGKGVACRWSFVPTAECCLRTLLLAAPTSGGTWDSLLHAGAVESYAWRLPRKSKSTLESARRHKPQKRQLNSWPPRMKLVRGRRNSWRHPSPSPHHSPVEASEHLDIFVCFNQEQGGRTSMLDNHKEAKPP